MSKLTRTLLVGAMLAAVTLAGMTTVAHAYPLDPATDRPATAQQRSTGDATARRLVARERSTIPNQTAAQVPAPTPAQPNRQPSWFLVSFGVLAVLVLATGLAVLAARRASRRIRPRAASLTHNDPWLGPPRSPTAGGPAQTPSPGSSGLHRERRSIPMPMQPIHRLADLGQRSDGGVEWACPLCGRYLVRYPATQLVLAAGAAGAAHVLGPGYRDDPPEVPRMSEFDEQFLHRHAMAWSADHRPE